jgi:small subunit ribosomal protein S6
VEIMRKYEVMFILRSNLEEEKRNAAIEKFKGIIEADGEIESIDEWGNRKLAYEINKVNEGYYVLVNFKAGADVPKELDRNFKISDDVMRHLIVNLEEK